MNQPILFNKIWKKFHTLEKQLEQSFEKNEEQKQLCLKERALKLAQETPQLCDSGPQLEVVSFQLEAETYAIESLYIQSISRLLPITSLPCTPEFVAGLINLRGHIQAVIDLKSLFRLSRKVLSPSKMIHIQFGDFSFSLLIDQVLSVNFLPFAEIAPPLESIKELSPDFLKGINKQGVIILDIEKMISDPGLIINQERTLYT